MADECDLLFGEHHVIDDMADGLPDHHHQQSAGDDQQLVIHEEVIDNDDIDDNDNDDELLDEDDDDDGLGFDEEDEDELRIGADEREIGDEDDDEDEGEGVDEDDIDEEDDADVVAGDDNDLDGDDTGDHMKGMADESEDNSMCGSVTIQGDEKVGENEVFQWSAFTGLRVKTFTADELTAFRKPFEMGWKREVVLRGTVTSSGKKIGDVYYFSGDKKTKLRSYVEMGLFLKRNPNSGLVPENFTFARQPIYRPPDEIVRHAMQRGGGQHQLQPSQIIDSSPFTPAPAPKAERSARNSTASESEEQFAMSIAEGRAKRKRVAPSRFEDEDYSEASPFKKKSKPEKGGMNSVGGPQQSSLIGGKTSNHQKQIPMQSKTPMSLQEKRRQLQHQLLQQVHEQSMKKQQQERQQQGIPASQLITNNGTDSSVVTNNNNSHNSVNNIEESIAITSVDANGKQTITPLNARKSISSSNSTIINRTGEEDNSNNNNIINNNNNNANVKANDASDKSDGDGVAQDSNQQAGVPCSMHCPGRRGMLPNLMCSRCFCLYHLDCVPGGVFLKEPRVFVCPNCLKPEDSQTETNSANVATNGIEERDDISQTSNKSLYLSSTPLILSQPLAPKPRTFAPILPKPPQMALQQQHMQQQIYPKKKFVPSLPAQTAAGFPASAMNVKLPAGTHLYRVTTGPNGHSMIVKNKAFKPKQSLMTKSARKTSISAPLMSSNPPPVHRFPYYKMAPIAPIAPIKITAKQIQQMFHPQVKRKTRGYRDWMEKRKRVSLQSLVFPYLCMNKILSYLSAVDLIRLKRVSRVWHQLSSQPFLWREIALKGISIIDWQYLARNIIETNQSAELDFDGIRFSAQSNADLCDLWRNFATIVDYLKSVKRLKFGSIPTFVLEEITNAALTENCYNSFANLELISVKNLFEEDSPIKECNLSFLESFHYLPQLKTLQLNCKNGFVADQNGVELMTEVFAKLDLQTLVLTSLKEFASEQFVFLQSLQKLKHLEIGSCGNWFQCDDDSSNEISTNENDNSEIANETPPIDTKSRLKGAFKYLSQLSNLETLRLVDITIDDCSSSLPLMLESLLTLQTLTIDNFKIETSGIEVLDHLCAILKSLPMNSFSLSTNEPHTNRCVFDLLKKLDNCSKLLWKVGALVEDSGECFVPFTKQSDDNPEDADGEQDCGDENADDNSLKYMDLTFLNEVIQSELANTIIEIIPQ